MNHVKATTRLVAVIATMLCATAVFAQTPTIDYLGFGWETGGMPPSAPGDEFVFVGVADNADPLFGVDLGGYTMVTYTGGTMDIWADSAMNADWGVNPPNGTAPSTFNDGTLYFRGAFTSFTVFMSAAGAGSFEGNLDGVEGELIGDVCTDCAYSWGGIFSQEAGAQIPTGYDFQMDGVFEVDPAIGNDDATWSDLKSLYR